MRKIACLALTLLAVTNALTQSTLHGNVHTTGMYEKPGPTRFGGVKWAFKAGGAIVTSPAVADGVVYVGTSDSARFMALDAKTGALKFNFDAKAYIFSSAAVAGDLGVDGKACVGVSDRRLEGRSDEGVESGRQPEPRRFRPGL